MSSLPPPSATGVRIAGDRYQWAIAWHGCVTAVRDARFGHANPVVAVGIEAPGAGNLDDVVLYRTAPPHTYAQVKYAVDAATPISEDYLCALSDSGGPSILEKIAESWRKVTSDATQADLVLITNRYPDHGDPLISGRDSRTGLLMPKAGRGGPRSAQGKARARWASVAKVQEPDLRALLETLRFDVGRDAAQVPDQLALLMMATGLRSDPQAVDAGIDWVARQVLDGHRRLELNTILDAIAHLDLEAEGPARAVVSIATLAPDPAAADADYALDWVDRFEGDDPFLKRHPALPATWQELQHDIEAAPSHLPPGTQAVALTGTVRLAPAFLAGAAFRMVTGTDVAVRQRGQVWCSTQAATAQTPDCAEHVFGQGNDLAVAIAVATDPTDDVMDYLREASLPVARLLVYRPATGSGDNSVPDGRAAAALALGIRDHLRRTCRRYQSAGRIHLFQACPMGLAVLMGHRWNGLRPTTIYEDLTTTYEPAFHINA
ncbi:SAVED domain-containing protein [Kitasatospora sp. NPDC036755]|uniref:SAVED domain-containing protein n=1 Tax=Kitasatospora sp. NPDC036755 TaxID=3154600 RepID=UPI0033DDE349